MNRKQEGEDAQKRGKQELMNKLMFIISGLRLDEIFTIHRVMLSKRKGEQSRDEERKLLIY